MSTSISTTSRISQRLDDPSECPFTILPTEIWYHVLSFLDPNDKMLFARCSWLCFFIAFPNQVKLPEDAYDWSLKAFSEGGRLEMFKHRVRSVRFDISNIKRMSTLVHRAATFPNVCRLEINLTGCNTSRGVLAAMFFLLSALPYYDNLVHLTLEWHGWGPGASAQRAEPKFLSSLRSAGAAYSLDEINFPKCLKSLTLKINTIYNFLPLINYEGVTSLKFLNPLYRTGSVSSGIKNLTLDTQYSFDRLGLEQLPSQFPNVECFSLVRIKPQAPDQSWIQYIPMFSKITDLVIAWPRSDGKYIDISVLESDLRTKLSTSGDLQTLRTVAFVGIRDFADHRRNIRATCTISTQQSKTSEKTWNFKWEGNISDYQDDPSFWESLLSDLSGDEWEEGNTDDGEISELDDEDESGSEASEEYDSDYFEHLASDDELFGKELEDDEL